MLDLRTLTWRCDACHRERLDAQIKVLTYPLKISKYASRNFKYCSDNPLCFAIAAEHAKKGVI